jgi:serine phosphatase RsbU (regulator of sigma subunit)
MRANFLSGRRKALSGHRELVRQRELKLLLAQLIQPDRRTDQDVCGLRVSVRCVSAEPDLCIGGDWYLALPLSCGDLVLAVGDVMGHGRRAAAEMVRLRFAMAAFAAQGWPPAVILSRLNTLLYEQETLVTATALVARYNVRTGELIWARAGHPPLLAGDRETVGPLPNPAGPLLGLFGSVVFDQASVILPPGHIVVMYTDGIIRRGQSMEDAAAALSYRFRDLSAEPDRILDDIDYQCAKDDACVLVAQRTC